MDEALARRALKRDLTGGHPQRWEPEPEGRSRRERSGRDDDARDRPFRNAEFREPAERGSARRAGAEESERAWVARGLDRGSDRELERGYGRTGERGGEALDQRLERWVNRGRELVDGVAGTRPGSRPADRRGGGALRRGPQAAQGNGGLGAGGLNPARLGRWVEERIDWFLDEDREDDWREPWQERQEAPAVPPLGRSQGLQRQDRLARPQPAEQGPFTAEAPPPAPAARGTERRGLEAISRRAARQAASDQPPPRSGSLPPSAEPDGTWSDEAWPDEDSFSVPRWSRPVRPAVEGTAARLETPPSGRPAPSPATVPAPSPLPGRALPRSTRRR